MNIYMSSGDNTVLNINLDPSYIRATDSHMPSAASWDMAVTSRRSTVESELFVISGPCPELG